MYTTTTHTETRINVVEYIILNYDFDMSKHNTEYTYSINIDEGGTSVDVIELPSYTPNICKLIQISTRHQMVMVEKRIRVRRVIKEKELGWSG